MLASLLVLHLSAAASAAAPAPGPTQAWCEKRPATPVVVDEDVCAARGLAYPALGLRAEGVALRRSTR